VSIIYDRHGRQYGVNEIALSAGFIRFNIECLGKRVGYVNCHFESEDVLYLDDLRIEDRAIRPSWFSLILKSWAVSLSPARWRTVNYRERGLGTAMIKFLENYARLHGAKRLEGRVKTHDLRNYPDLVNWYRRRGFAVVMGGEKPAYIAKISLEIV
jgi:GNAT superfamily N-acetyltransferase